MKDLYKKFQDIFPDYMSKAITETVLFSTLTLYKWM